MYWTKGFDMKELLSKELYIITEAIIKENDDEIRRLNNLYADTIKELGDALIEIDRLKVELKRDLGEEL